MHSLYIHTSHFHGHLSSNYFGFKVSTNPMYVHHVISNQVHHFLLGTKSLTNRVHNLNGILRLSIHSFQNGSRKTKRSRFRNGYPSTSLTNRCNLIRRRRYPHFYRIFFLNGDRALIEFMLIRVTPEFSPRDNYRYSHLFSRGSVGPLFIFPAGLAFHLFIIKRIPARNCREYF